MYLGETIHLLKACVTIRKQMKVNPKRSDNFEYNTKKAKPILIDIIVETKFWFTTR